MSRRARRSVNKSGTAAALAAALITLTACFGTGENLPRGDGRITGVLYDQSSGAPLEGVTVTMDNRGGTCAATTESDGSFSLDTGMVVRGEGYNVRFYLQNYQHASRAAVFQLPNLRVDLGRVDLYDSGPVEERTVTGRILDNLSDDGLADAGVSVQVTYAPLPGGDTVTETYVALTDGQGNFRVTGKGFMLHSSYVLTVSKTNYITRSDVTVLVAGSSSVMDGGAAHLILNFGNIAGTVIDDNQFKFTERLFQNGAYRFKDIPFSIIRRNNDADEWHQLIISSSFSSFRLLLIARAMISGGSFLRASIFFSNALFLS